MCIYLSKESESKTKLGDIGCSVFILPTGGRRRGVDLLDLLKEKSGELRVAAMEEGTQVHRTSHIHQL